MAHSRSFDEVFSAEFPPLHRYIHRRLGPGLADDLAAETFAIAYASWDRYDRGRPLRPWLYGIAANLVFRHWRDEERKLRAYAATGVDPVAELDELGALRRIDAGERHRELAGVLAELAPRDRELLLLHAWAELSDDEIATVLSVPIGTVKSRLHRVRARVRARLEHDEPVAVVRGPEEPAR